ncbi:MAG TPA: serine protease, partial [Thermoanaerobaculia bacterium]|nr:serine protease [Thermoanaerobaculia bacterium]
MSPRTSALCLLLLGAALLAPPVHAAAPDAPGLDWLKQQTVAIEITNEPPKPVEHGSGVVICESNHRVYVLTANHVLYGTNPSGQLRLNREVQKIRVAFYRSLAGAVEDEPDSDAPQKIQRTPFPSLDLLLVAFELPEDLAAQAVLRRSPPSVALGRQDAGRRVLAIGYDAPQEREWEVARGSLEARSGELLAHTAKIVPGFSGGPLFAESGELLGINIERRGEGEESTGGYALPIAVVRAAVEKLLPAACLRDEGEEQIRRSAAEAAYREALRRVSRKDWEGASRALSLALENNPFEGGSVHLQGMRYARYLPHFYRGLVLYHESVESRGKGGDPTACGRALDELEISAVQGEIERSPRRLRELRKLKD